MKRGRGKEEGGRRMGKENEEGGSGKGTRGRGKEKRRREEERITGKGKA